MQYLSKAYNFYSGINPATLSGAIDVIVVRHVDSDGQVTLASTPFHVRFGKLQVLRAGEKRVTLKLPNNLPAPHTAPFSMKVGETGEAFFVLETSEEVPEELLTSPVVMASEPNELLAPVPFPNEAHGLQSDPAGSTVLSGTPPRPAGAILTREPFGETEQQNDHDRLGEVDFLDLNASQEEASSHSTGVKRNADTISPSSILNSATSLLPTFPFLASHSPLTSQTEDRGSLSHADVNRLSQNQPPNPMTAQPGEQADLPIRDHKLSNFSQQEEQVDGSPGNLVNHVDHDAESGLPKVKPGEGEGPKVVYGTDVVLDMAGYHNDPTNEFTKQGAYTEEDINHIKNGNPLVETFALDLLAAIDNVEQRSRPPLTHNRLTDSAVPSVSHPVDALPKTEHIAANSASATQSRIPYPSTGLSKTTSQRKNDRGQSEPPPDGDSPSRVTRTSSPKVPNDQIASAAVMDYAWDWGRLPRPSIHSGDIEGFDVGSHLERRASSSSNTLRPDRIRADSMPPSSLELAVPPDREEPIFLTHAKQNPYLLILKATNGTLHSFELALCGSDGFAREGTADKPEETIFMNHRVSLQKFMEDPEIVDNPALVVRYGSSYLTWRNGRGLLQALSLYRRSLIGGPTTPFPDVTSHTTSGSGWSRWWRRNQIHDEDDNQRTQHLNEDQSPETPLDQQPHQTTHYAKTLRLSSDQLKQLQLKPGPNTVQFSVTSSYSGVAVCTARIFLWDDTDQIVISDIDGTITKSDALGHVFAAIGRDWTHLGIARLYTDICNNGYKIMYLTSRAIGQADSTREYLKSIAQGEYRLPEGPVIMSPDRLMASLHREVIMRKPELFKMACLRDIQRLFGDKANEAFYAGFGNRITDAMSYRSVGVETSKIYTIDSTGVVRTELLQAAGHKGSYVALNDLVNEVFPPVTTKFKPEFTDFNFWRPTIADIPLPDLVPPSPALSARSDTSSRYSVLGKIASIGRRSSRQPILPTTSVEASSRPSSPLIGPALTPDELTEDEESGSRGSMPGSFESRGDHMPRRGSELSQQSPRDENSEQDETEDRQDDSFDDGAIFDDDILATGEMKNVPF